MRTVDWPAVLAHMDATGDGPRATARALQIPAGTVLAGVKRERDRRAAQRDGLCRTCGQTLPAGGEHG